MPGRPKNNSKTRLANKIGVSVESFQDAHAAKSKNLSKKVEFSRGCPLLGPACAELDKANAAYIAHASRENYMWLRRAHKEVETLRAKLRQISA
jgi:hypothetical protein